VNDLSMYYEEHGLPSGPPMVLLHGFNGAGARTWHRQVPIFSELYRLLPNAELCILPNTGHGVLGQHPALITQLVQDFLARRIEHAVSGGV
jgi:pimeloyl-ACP methyl ester carboxylesterase